jgi:hypothetical protein
MKRFLSFLLILLTLTSLVRLRAQTPVRGEQPQPARRATSASEAGINAAGYGFSATLSGANGTKQKVQGILTLLNNPDGTVKGVLSDSLTGNVYTVSSRAARGLTHLTFSAPDGGSFTGTANLSLSPDGLMPLNLSGSALGDLGTGTWTASDGVYFITTGIFDLPGLACYFCQLYHFCSALPNIPCTACRKACR